jgi:hypothetical protein
MRWGGHDPSTLLPAIIEGGFEDRPATSLRAEFPTAVAYLEQIGALKPGSTLRTVWCKACDKDHDATVELDSTGKARHFCAEAGWVDDKDDDIATLRLDPEWLLDWLERLFSVRPPWRRRLLLRHRIWHVGEALLGKTSMTIIFSRGIVAPAELSAALARIPPTQVGIVLTTAAEMPAALLAAYGYCAVDLGEILRANPDGLSIDLARFGAFVRAFARKTGRPVAGGGGRPSQATLILEVFRARRTRNVPYRSKYFEATEIIAEWPALYPDSDPPGHSTIRRHLRNLEK